MFKTAKLTDTGLKRKHNEDACLVMEESDLFLVSDGMGGHAKGEVASKLIVETFEELFSRDIADDEETVPCTTEDHDATLRYSESKYAKIHVEYVLNRIIEEATTKIIHYAKANEIDVKMGTTLVGIHKLKDMEELAVFHLGDSRAYRVRNYQIERLTVDHSKYEEMKRSGKYSAEELAKVSRSSITKAVGNFKAKTLEINFVELEKNDIFLLCSDGVSDLCSDEELLNEVLQNKNTLNEVCTNIKSLVYERGARDNLTLIISKY